MPDKYLVPEKSTLSILDNNVDFESHAIINSRPTTTNIPQAPSLSTLSALIMGEFTATKLILFAWDISTTPGILH